MRNNILLVMCPLIVIALPIIPIIILNFISILCFLDNSSATIIMVILLLSYYHVLITSFDLIALQIFYSLNLIGIIIYSIFSYIWYQNIIMMIALLLASLVSISCSSFYLCRKKDNDSMFINQLTKVTSYESLV